MVINNLQKSNNKRDEIKRAAQGRWPEILSAVCKIDAKVLDGKNHPCPKCGGRDRFRLIKQDVGSVYCNQCFNTKNGDGIAAVMWATGCTFPEALQMIGDFLGVPAESKNGKAKIVATYNYCDENGMLIFQAVRFDPKDFRQRKPKDGGGWDWSVKGLRVIPYRLPELMKSQDTVFVVEGEKDVDRLAGLGIVATCNAGGAGKWRSDHAQYLAGRIGGCVAGQ